LMNNDLVVTPEWLTRMIECAERSSGIGIVGPMSNYVSGPQLVEDVSYDTISLAGLNKFSRAFARKHSGQTKPFWRVVGFCMLIKRGVFQIIGGLDGRYGLGNFEDDDFSLRAVLAGFESWIAEDCFVHHFGSRTFASAKIDYKESLHKNWEIFKQKWGIPADVAYGAPYDMAFVLKDGFIPEKHYCLLWPKEYSVASGEKLFSMGDIEEAKRIFKRILSASPDNTDTLNNLGVIAFQEGEIDQATSYFTRVLKIDENYFEAIGNLGKCAEIQKNYRKAIEWFEKALRVKPDETSLLNSLGNCFIMMEKKMGKEKQKRNKRKVQGDSTSVQQISLCMIVKDEESSLGRCLESIKDEVDEIIIVDTGSKDRTVEIARQYTDKIYFHPWENSFSKARNYSLKYATGDWIFILDADEELDGGSIGLIRKSIKDEYADAFNVGTKSFVNKGKGLTFHKTPRLFRNNGSVHYEGIVHNQVVGCKSLKDSDIVVLHHGYNVDHGTRTKKFNRTTPLLYEQIRQNPTDPSPYINLSNSFMTMELYRDASDASQKAIDLMREQNRYPNLGSVAYYNRSICYFNQNDFMNMVVAGKDCQRNYPDDVDSCVILAFGYRGLGKWDHVVKWGNAYLNKIEKIDEVGSRVIMSLSDIWKVHLFMGEAHLHRHSDNKAIEHFNMSLRLANERETCLNAIILILSNQKRFIEAEPFVDIALKENICENAVKTFNNNKSIQDHIKGGKTNHVSNKGNISQDIRGKRPNISLCMIVKDESEFLRRCLKSVSSLVDEIVIVDTGSSDKTIEIAKELGARVFSYKWDEDFSNARNAGLSRVRGKWTLILDADEVISQKDHKRIQHLVQDEKTDGYRMILRNYVKSVNLSNAIPNPNDYEEGLDLPGFIQARLIRLFKTCPDIYFTGSVHETLDASFVKQGKTVLDTEIPIHHYGKVRKDRIRNKQELYLKLGEERLRDAPYDPMSYKGLADQYLEIGMPEKALNISNRGMALFPEMAELHFSRGLALDRTCRQKDAEKEYLWVLAENPSHLGACHNLGQIYYSGQYYDRAVELLERAIQQGLRQPAIFFLLGRAHDALGDMERSMEAFERVSEIQRDYPGVNYRKAMLYLKMNMHDDAISALEREIKAGGNLVAAYNLLGEISFAFKDIQSASQFFQKVLAIKQEDPTAIRYLEQIRSN